MRSLDEVRERKLSGLRRMIERPDGWALDGRAMQTLAHGDLADLCFIDERDDPCSAQFDGLTRYGKLGVAGSIEDVDRSTVECVQRLCSPGALDERPEIAELVRRSFLAGEVSSE